MITENRDDSSTHSGGWIVNRLYERTRLLLLLAVSLSIACSTGCGLAALGASESEFDSDVDGTCEECTIDEDCEGDLVCTCVDNEETGEPFCYACAPEEYEPFQGSKQDETYTCESVDEND